MLRRLLVGSFIGALAACAADDALPQGAQCVADAECDGTLVCSFSHCVEATPNGTVLMARLTPPAASGLLPQQVDGLDLSGGPDLVVGLLASQTIHGVVTVDGDAFTLNVPGELEVRAADVIDGLDLRYTATSRSEVDNQGFGFELVVLPGRAYVGTFRPDDDELPAHRFTLDAASVAAGRFDLVLPAPAAYGVVSGRVRTADGPKPILDARVVVLGDKDDVLAVTRTDPERGQFEVLVAPDVESFRLKIEAPASGLVFPDFITERFEVGATLDIIVPDPPANMAAYDAVLRVVGQLEGDAEPAPISGLTVTLQGVLDGGTLRRTATTNELGEATFRVLSGTYECLVVAPPDMPLSSWHGLVDLAPQALALSPAAWIITLPPRPTFSGRVLDTFGRPVGAGVLTLERRVARKAGDLLAIAPPPITTQLGEDGTFALRVDPGTWDLMIAPDPETGAPHAHEAAIDIGPEGLHKPLNLPPPGLLHLTVADPAGAFLGDVGVELWIPDDEGPRLLARGATNTRGFVDLLVPHTDVPSL